MKNLMQKVKRSLEVFIVVITSIGGFIGIFYDNIYIVLSSLCAMCVLIPLSSKITFQYLKEKKN